MNSADQHGPSEITTRALALVREALLLRERGTANAGELSSALEALGDAARHDGLTPEAVLVRLKAMLNTVSLADQGSPDRRNDARDRIVSLAIKAYFADPERRPRR